MYPDKPLLTSAFRRELLVRLTRLSNNQGALVDLRCISTPRNPDEVEGQRILLLDSSPTAPCRPSGPSACLTRQRTYVVVRSKNRSRAVLKVLGCSQNMRCLPKETTSACGACCAAHLVARSFHSSRT